MSFIDSEDDQDKGGSHVPRRPGITNRQQKHRSHDDGAPRHESAIDHNTYAPPPAKRKKLNHGTYQSIPPPIGYETRKRGLYVPHESPGPSTWDRSSEEPSGHMDGKQNPRIHDRVPQYSYDFHHSSYGSYQRHAPPSDYETHNFGNSNQTYNGCHVRRNSKQTNDKRHYNRINIHLNTHTTERVHEAESSESSASSSSDRSSTSNVELTPSSSLITSPSHSPGIPVSTAKPASVKGKGKELTPSQLYETLLLGGFGCEVGCGIAIPLWKPSPRATRGNHTYTLEIGDVGVFSDGLPFNTLFNITQSKDSMTNRNRVPEGVDPPCKTEDDSITVIDDYHRAGTTLTKPRGSISHQQVQDSKGSTDQGSSRIFTFDLSQEEGALLMLPRGASLEKLVGTEEFKRRIKQYWREWYEFAGSREDGGRMALFVVTGVAKCSMWAIAVWDSNTSDKLRSLELAVDGNIPMGTVNQLKETVFVGGFWISKGDRDIGLTELPSGSDGNGDAGEDETDPHEGRRDQGNSRSPPSNDLSSHSFSPARSSAGGGGYSGSSRALSGLADSLNEMRVNVVDLDLFAEDFDQENSPCQVINKFALMLISKARPALLGAGCISFSHDDDWISVVKDSEPMFPKKTELIRRISSTSKFVVEQDAIYPESMSDFEKLELVQHCSSFTTTVKLENVITALVEFREPEVPEEGTFDGDILQTAILESEDTSQVTSAPSIGDAPKVTTLVPSKRQVDIVSEKWGVGGEEADSDSPDEKIPVSVAKKRVMIAEREATVEEARARTFAPSEAEQPPPRHDRHVQPASSYQDTRPRPSYDRFDHIPAYHQCVPSGNDCDCPTPSEYRSPVSQVQSDSDPFEDVDAVTTASSAQASPFVSMTSGPDGCSTGSYKSNTHFQQTVSTPFNDQLPHAGAPATASSTLAFLAHPNASEELQGWTLERKKRETFDLDISLEPSAKRTRLLTSKPDTISASEGLDCDKALAQLELDMQANRGTGGPAIWINKLKDKVRRLRKRIERSEEEVERLKEALGSNVRDPERLERLEEEVKRLKKAWGSNEVV
ncbi:hypothetical protein V5O48_018451 [Marasmius crinis-equi]|uniref:Uncharacterized protein n=1 Tax=Marasmius crinis-equi TaxID=585013 RepID=A0ABR3EL57_9AGAR